MRLPCILLLVAVMVIPGEASQRKKSRVTVSRASAVKIVHNAFPGAAIVSQELERENGIRVWSFDLKDHDTIKEVWIDARSGEIVSTSVETPAQEAGEAAGDHARSVALKRVPGEVVSSSTKESRGRTLFAFEIRTKKGITVRVDVDSVSQKIVNIQSESPAN